MASLDSIVALRCSRFWARTIDKHARAICTHVKLHLGRVGENDWVLFRHDQRVSDKRMIEEPHVR